jgi:hypothetical protein
VFTHQNDNFQICACDNFVTTFKGSFRIIVKYSNF